MSQVEVSPKGVLPYGWTVQPSKNYPDRVYYFNHLTGASMWDCPVLDPPRVLSEDEVKNKTVTNFKKPDELVLNEDMQFNSGKNVKPCTPPTAVVVPVIHKQKEVDYVVDSKQPKKCKQKVSIESNMKDVALKKKAEKKKAKKKMAKERKKLASNKSSSEKSLDGKLDTKSPSSKLEKTVVTSDKETSEDNSKDVEMHDVSMDLLDLIEKKETLFDTTACYYIIVDTNVLIGEIHLISELKDTPLDGCGPPHIFIPWVVIEELDKLKSQRSIKSTQRLAGDAIRYLNNVLGKHPRFHGQSPAEAEEWAKTYSKCNDDKILECCMALQDKMPPEKVILLTNDKNLVNKALICKINVHNFESMMKKVKPDTTFHYERTKMGKKKKKEKQNEESKDQKSPKSLSLGEKFLQSQQEKYKCQIHTIMSSARSLLKEVLSRFLKDEMQEAYGDIWLKFGIEEKLLRGILEGIKKYWKSVYSLFLSEKDHRNFEFLYEKERRPEGFFGDKDECLIILSAIEDVFRQIQRKRPHMKIPTEQIQDYRVACVTAFAACSDAESSIRAAEENSVRTMLDTSWTAINQLCGTMLDEYKVPHNFNYEKLCQPLQDFEIRHLMTILYPGVQEFQRLLTKINELVDKSMPTKKFTNALHAALLRFVSSLKLQCDPTAESFFTSMALERFFTSSQNRQMIQIGIEQITAFHKKLDEVLRVMSLPHLRNSSPVPEVMICD